MNNNVNTQSTQQVNSTQLFIGGFLFLSTIAYWFNQGSGLSLINAFIKRIGIGGIDGTILLVLHLILNTLGWGMILGSGLNAQIGQQIAALPFITNAFYKNKPFAVRIRDYIRWILLIFLTYILVFDLLIPFISTTEVSSFSFFTALTLWTLSSIIKNIDYIQPNTCQQQGLHDFSEEQKWIRLSGSQIAYVQTGGENDSFELFTGEKPINVSLRQVYVIETQGKTFNHTIDDDLLTRDANGELGYYFRMSIDLLGKLPHILQSNNLKYIFLKLTNREEVKEEIFRKNDKNEIINEVKNSLLSRLEDLDIQKIKDMRKNDSINSTLEELNKISLSGIQTDLRKTIIGQLEEQSGLSNLIKIEFTFKQSKYFQNEIISRIKERQKEIEETERIEIEAQRLIFQKQLDNFYEERKMVLNAIINAQQNIIIGKTERENLLLLKLEIDKMNPISGRFDELELLGAKLKSIDEQRIQIESVASKPTQQIALSPIEDTLKEQVDDIADDLTILIATTGGKLDEIKEEITSKHTFFKDRNIDIYRFFELLEDKIPDFTTKRDKKYYRKIVMEVVEELI